MAKITFLVHKGKEYTIAKYLASWGQELADRVAVRHYPRLHSTGHTWLKRLSQEVRALRVGTLEHPGPPTGEPQIYVFTDIERLSRSETATAEDLFRRLEAHPDTALMLNHPVHSRRRLELLQTLKARGLNSFGVYPAAAGPTPVNWPVFVRDENEHGGSFSDLLQSQAELEAELSRLRPTGLASKVVVEHCDTADAKGIIRKFGAFRIGDRIVARQIHFSRHWVVRVPDLKAPWTAREELEYVEDNPRQQELMEIFELARIDYGRVDYSVLDGKIQVWEINTNPMVLIPKDRDDPLRFAAHDRFGQQLNATLSDLLARVSD
ncbi:MAG: hypothetical protein AAF560_02890 [Acidobacteriota bacterium]